MDSRFRGNDDSSVNAVIPTQAGMTTRHGDAPKAMTVIPAKAGIHESRGGSGTSIQAGHGGAATPESRKEHRGHPRG